MGAQQSGSEDAFAMGSSGGAKAMLLDKIIGSIEEGKKADLAILNPGTSLVPRNDLISQLVLSENGKSVETVFVNGKQVVSHGSRDCERARYFSSALCPSSPHSSGARKSFEYARTIGITP